MILWCMQHQIDLVAVHLPGLSNVLADKLSRQIMPYHNWELSSRVTQKIFHFWSTPDVDLFSTIDNRKLSKFLFSSVSSSDGSRGRDAPVLDRTLSLRLSSTSHDHSDIDEGGEGAGVDDSDCSQVDPEGLVSHSPGPSGGFSMEVTSGQGSGNSMEWDVVACQPSRVATGGLVDQRNKLLATGLSQEAAETVLAARSKKTHQCYQSGWGHFFQLVRIKGCGSRFGNYHFNCELFAGLL